MKRGLLFVILSFCSFQVLWAQSEKVDSLQIETLIQQAFKQSNDSLQLAFVTIQKAKILANSSGAQRLIANVVFQEGILYFETLNYDSAIVAFTKSAHLFQQVKDKFKEARSYNAVGRTYLYLGNYSKSLKNLFNALEIAKSIKNKNSISSISIDIGLVYQEFKDWDNALIYFNNALSIEKERRDTATIGIILHNIADAYRGKNEYKKSIVTYKEAISMHEKVKDYSAKATSTSDMANVYLANNKLDSAIFYKQEAVNYYSNHKTQSYLSDYCYAYASLGSMLAKANRLKEADYYRVQCNECVSLLNDLIYAKMYYSFLYEFYKKKKDNTNALKNLELYNVANDSITIQSISFENLRSGIKYEFTQKAKEDSLQYQLKFSKQELATSKYRNRNYLLLIILLLLIGLAVTIYRRLKLKQERKRTQELEKLRHNIAGDLHDDVGSTLSSIQILSEIASQQCGDNLPLKQSILSITELSNKVSNGIRELMWTVNPAHDKLESLVGQLRKIASGLLEFNNINFRLIENIQNPKKILSAAQRKEILMIFKEAVNNARKYSKCKHIEVEVREESELLLLSIKDDGQGFDINNVKLGNGLNNMKYRVEKLKGKLEIQSENNKGTRILLQMPLP
ncbi:MAG TPA: tetratricopeptide repeat protein [Edaphocola sp.]|nr:tetratricopeptide repeat protein [Edaphocola sp.]